jgi:predicted glycosyltransferase involved in capsule biosynthesis
MVKCTLVITVKNRLNHFLQTFPSAITQYGIDYEVLYVNFHSNDQFEDRLFSEAEFREPMFSPYLKSIKQIKLLQDISFSPRKSKNMSVPYSDIQSELMSFSDVDVFISSNYLHYWCNKVIKGGAFVATRIQETRASAPKRIKSEINYGNFLVSKEDFLSVGGMDESVGSYGGDDDDIYHRLKLNGLREINPHDELEARSYSILHGDDLRLNNFEITERVDQTQAFERVYGNTSSLSPQSNFLDKNFLQNKVVEKTVFKRK